MAEELTMLPAVVGREAELARVTRFVAGAGTQRALAIVGEPGIGKTTLWEAACAAAAEGGAQVLVARASEPELQLAYVALSDLLEGIDVASVAGVPAPQRRALQIALLRTDPDGLPPESLSVATGFTRVLRSLSEQGPVLVAVDDVPWLDRSSHDALAFAARRLRHVRFLLTRRTGPPPQLELAFQPTGLQRLEIGALSLGAIRALVVERLELRPPRRVLLRLFELSQGSPLVALELGRMLIAQGLPDVGDELPLPDLVDELFSHRIGGLTAPVRRALLAVALTGELARFDLSSLVGPLVVDDAIAAGVVIRDRSRVRASHPLLAAAARRLTTAEERRELHLELANAVDDEAMRARHLALAASAPDDELADRLAVAASKAVDRGAVHDGVELAEHALRLTPVVSSTYEERMFTLVRYLRVAGELARLRELLEARVTDLPPGAARARAYLELSDGGERTSQTEGYLDAALEECGSDSELRAAILSMKALVKAVVRLADYGLAETWAEEAQSLAATGGIDVQRRALHVRSWIEVVRGRPLELDEDIAALPGGVSLYESAVERPAAIRSMIRGHVDDSRVVFEQLRALAGERGEAVSASIMHRQLCEIELRAGDVRAAEGHLELWGEWTLPDDPHERIVGPARCRALLGAVKGDPEQAIAWGTKAIEAARAIENFREETEARRAIGIAALFAHDHERAVGELNLLWQHAEHEHIDDPGVFPVAPDLVESLVQLGSVDEARAVAERLERLSVEQAHPWGLAGVRRCRALIGLASGDDVEAAEADLAEAAAAYAELGLRFDAARTLLLLGRSQRRRKKWAAARESLEGSAAVFTEVAATGWADEARAELSRIGARRPTPEGALSSTERKVAELAAKGQSNKAIAAELHVTVNTVEKHLSHAYAKLGVSSRGQLAQHLPPSG